MRNRTAYRVLRAGEEHGSQTGVGLGSSSLTFAEERVDVAGRHAGFDVPFHLTNNELDIRFSFHRRAIRSTEKLVGTLSGCCTFILNPFMDCKLNAHVSASMQKRRGRGRGTAADA